MHANDDARALAKLRGLSLAGVIAAQTDGVLRFGKHRESRAWFAEDKQAACARRLDGKVWTHRSQPSKADDLPGTSGRRVIGWPIGLLRAREHENILVCEGGPDLLAAYCARDALRANFGIVCLLGSGLSIHESTRRSFAGKSIRFIAHNDAAGLEFAERNAALLAPVATTVSIISLDGLLTTRGAAASDLCDALAFRDPWCVPDEIAELLDFTIPPKRGRIVPVQCGLFDPSATVPKTVTQENPRITHREHRKTHKMEEREKSKTLAALHAKARELACTQRTQTYRRLFLLAQAVCGYFGHRDGKTDPLSTEVFDMWFGVSRPHLDPKESRAHYLGRFRAAFKKVRVIPNYHDTLAKAEERARTATPPEIPDVPDAPEGWRRLAAVCFELQRAAGDTSFFIGVRDAARIATGSRHAQTGSRILEALGEFGVIRCVKRGEQRLGGNASEFRYMLP